MALVNRWYEATFYILRAIMRLKSPATRPLVQQMAELTNVASQFRIIGPFWGSPPVTMVSRQKGPVINAEIFSISWRQLENVILYNALFSTLK